MKCPDCGTESTLHRHVNTNFGDRKCSECGTLFWSDNGGGRTNE